MIMSKSRVEIDVKTNNESNYKQSKVVPITIDSELAKINYIQKNQKKLVLTKNSDEKRVNINI